LTFVSAFDAVLVAQHGPPFTQHGSPAAQQSPTKQHSSGGLQQLAPGAQQSAVLTATFGVPAPAGALVLAKNISDASTATEATTGAINFINMNHSPD
jgi:hypothetical protein